MSAANSSSGSIFPVNVLWYHLQTARFRIVRSFRFDGVARGRSLDRHSSLRRNVTPKKSYSVEPLMITPEDVKYPGWVKHRCKRTHSDVPLCKLVFSKNLEIPPRPRKSISAMPPSRPLKSVILEKHHSWVEFVFFPPPRRTLELHSNFPCGIHLSSFSNLIRLWFSSWFRRLRNLSSPHQEEAGGD